MSGKLLRAGKTLPRLEGHRKAGTVKQSPKNPKVRTKEAAMCDTILKELKSKVSKLIIQFYR